MYDELVKRLRAGEYTLEELSIILPKAADVIEELSDIARITATIIENEKDMRVIAKTPRWVPVTERLPEAWEEVMLQFPNNQAAGFFDGDCGWGVFSGDDFYTYVAPEEVHPTHWAKKLPEPTKEET